MLLSSEGSDLGDTLLRFCRLEFGGLTPLALLNTPVDKGSNHLVTPQHLREEPCALAAAAAAAYSIAAAANAQCGARFHLLL